MELELEVRRARTDDRPATERVMREAFWNRYGPGCCEHYLLHVMRACPAYVPELDLVATVGGDVVGSSACLRSVVEGDDGVARAVLSLGPIAAAAASGRQARPHRALGKDEARLLGFGALLLCGDLAYYGCRGGRACSRIRIGLRHAHAGVSACELFEGALAGAAGRYVEDAAYEVDEAAAAAYDARFPARERVVGTPSQLRFQEVAARRRDAFGR